MKYVLDILRTELADRQKAYYYYEHCPQNSPISAETARLKRAEILPKIEELKQAIKRLEMPEVFSREEVILLMGSADWSSDKDVDYNELIEKFIKRKNQRNEPENKAR